MEEHETNQIYENLGYTNEKNDVKQNNVLPKDYMTLAIITTILSFFFCNPVGLIVGGIAINFGNQVFREYVQGNYSRALSKSNKAKILTYINIGIVALFLVCYIIYIVVIIIKILSTPLYSSHGFWFLD